MHEYEAVGHVADGANYLRGHLQVRLVHLDEELSLKVSESNQEDARRHD